MKNEIKYIPHQLCPLCNGQGIVSKPAYIPNDVNYWAIADTSHTCHLCSGMKIIPMIEVIANKKRTMPVFEKFFINAK